MVLGRFKCKSWSQAKGIKNTELVKYWGYKGYLGNIVDRIIPVSLFLAESSTK